jgi:probable addiction module antidote protein
VKTKAYGSFNDIVVGQLRADPEFAVEYLRAAIEDTEEPRVLLIALRRLAEAHGGMAKVAKAAGVRRESLYRALSPRGNPRFATLLGVMNAMGYRLNPEKLPPKPAAKSK